MAEIGAMNVLYLSLAFCKMFYLLLYSNCPKVWGEKGEEKKQCKINLFVLPCHIVRTGYIAVGPLVIVSVF